jgi:hypothetical protein
MALLVLRGWLPVESSSGGGVESSDGQLGLWDQLFNPLAPAHQLGAFVMLGDMLPPGEDEVDYGSVRRGSQHALAEARGQWRELLQPLVESGRLASLLDGLRSASAAMVTVVLRAITRVCALGDGLCAALMEPLTDCMRAEILKGSPQDRDNDRYLPRLLFAAATLLERSPACRRMLRDLGLAALLLPLLNTGPAYGGNDGVMEEESEGSGESKRESTLKLLALDVLRAAVDGGARLNFPATTEKGTTGSSSSNSSSSIAAEDLARILPSVVHLLGHSEHRVQACALRTLTTLALQPSGSHALLCSLNGDRGESCGGADGDESMGEANENKGEVAGVLRTLLQVLCAALITPPGEPTEESDTHTLHMLRDCCLLLTLLCNHTTNTNSTTSPTSQHAAALQGVRHLLEWSPAQRGVGVPPLLSALLRQADSKANHPEREGNSPGAFERAELAAALRTLVALLDLHVPTPTVTTIAAVSTSTNVTATTTADTSEPSGGTERAISGDEDALDRSVGAVVMAVPSGASLFHPLALSLLAVHDHTVDGAPTRLHDSGVFGDYMEPAPGFLTPPPTPTDPSTTKGTMEGEQTERQYKSFTKQRGPHGRDHFRNKKSSSKVYGRKPSMHVDEFNKQLQQKGTNKDVGASPRKFQAPNQRGPSHMSLPPSNFGGGGGGGSDGRERHMQDRGSPRGGGMQQQDRRPSPRGGPQDRPDNRGNNRGEQWGGDPKRQRLNGGRGGGGNYGSQF